MSITFKFVSGNTANGPLGILNNPQHADLMVGTDCENPDVLDESFNWHFRVEGVPASDIYPRQLDGPSETYGTWFNPSLTSERDDDKCNMLGNWPMHVVQSPGSGSTYIWDIYVVPYLGGSYIEGIAPLLPIPGTQYTLQLFQGTTLYDTITSAAIPGLYPIFGLARDEKPPEDFWPIEFGYNYRDTTSQSTIHPGVDIVPLGLFSGGEPNPDWDEVTANAEYRKVFAVVGGTVLLDDIEGEEDVTDVIIYTEDEDAQFPDMQFIYSHIIPNPELDNNDPVDAGDLIGTILNHQLDSRSEKPFEKVK